MDAEKTAIAWLSERMGCPVKAAAPNPMPDRLVTVERTGGGDSQRVIDAAQIAVQCWAPTLDEAADLAQEARRALPRAAELDGVLYCSVGSVYRFPAEDGRPRYQITAEMTCYL